MKPVATHLPRLSTPPAAAAPQNRRQARVIGDQAAGIGVREDNSLITKDSSRFLPHLILD